MFARIKRLFCKHPQYVCPIVPLMGPAPVKFCTSCGQTEDMVPDDYKEDSNVLFEQSEPGTVEIIDMTPGAGR